MAVAIAAGVIATAVLAFAAIGQNRDRPATYEAIALPSGTLNHFYGDENFAPADTEIPAHAAPNYGQHAQAEVLREALYEDISRATAVYCLARSGPVTSTQRPVRIPVPWDADLRRIDTPDEFLARLAAAGVNTTGYESYSGESAHENVSIFVIQSASPEQWYVSALYEMDYVESVTPAGGHYATVRRYQESSTTPNTMIFTDWWYSVFYPDTAAVDFKPVLQFFPRAADNSPKRPFYFVWWPDPTEATFDAASTDQRSAFFMVLPMFPSL